jgi:hypothetical protein
VLRPHDAALARSIAGCSAKEWDGRGLLLERPLDLTDQPAVADSVQHCIGGPSSSVAACTKPATACRIDQTAAPSLRPGSSVSAAACHPCGDVGNSSYTGQQERVRCGICFEAYPADSMVSASLPAEMASSSRAAGRCGHTYCMGCMRQYIACELQVGSNMPPCNRVGCILCHKCCHHKCKADDTIGCPKGSFSACCKWPLHSLALHKLSGQLQGIMPVISACATAIAFVSCLDKGIAICISPHLLLGNDPSRHLLWHNYPVGASCLYSRQGSTHCPALTLVVERRWQPLM